MGGSSSKSDSSSDGYFKNDVWGGQAPYLKNLYSQAQQLFGQTNQQIQNQIPGSVNNLGQVTDQTQNAWQNQLGGGAYQDMGLQTSLMNSLNQSLNNPSAMQEINSMIMGGNGNNYADAMKNQFIGDANKAQSNMLANMDSRASAAGMSGGARHGVAIGRGLDDINSNLQRNMAEVGFNTFDKDLDRKLQIAQQADQGNLSRQQLMGNMIGQQQQTQNTGINNGQLMQGLNLGQFAPYMLPWQAMGAYANTLGNPTILGEGTQSGNSSSKSAGGGK